MKPVKILGQEWCKPIGDAPLLDYIVVWFGDGYVALCRVEQDTETGEVHRVMLRRSDLETATGRANP